MGLGRRCRPPNHLSIVLVDRLTIRRPGVLRVGDRQRVQSPGDPAEWRSMSAASDLVREAFRTEERRVDWRSGLAGAAGRGRAARDRAGGGRARGRVHGLSRRAECRALRAPRRSEGAAVVGLAGRARPSGRGRGGGVPRARATRAWSCSRSPGSRSGPSSGRPDRVGALLGFANSAVFVVFAGLPTTAPLGEQLAWFALGAVPAWR